MLIVFVGFYFFCKENLPHLFHTLRYFDSFFQGHAQDVHLDDIRMLQELVKGTVSNVIIYCYSVTSPLELFDFFNENIIYKCVLNNFNYNLIWVAQVGKIIHDQLPCKVYKGRPPIGQVVQTKYSDSIRNQNPCCITAIHTATKAGSAFMVPIK